MNKDKLVLRHISDKYINIVRIIFVISIILLISLSILSYLFSHIILSVILALLTIFYASILLYIINKKVIIQDSKIITINLFSKKGVGSIQDITSYSKDYLTITVFNNTKKMFTFNLNGSEDNDYFYSYLQKYKKVISLNNKFTIVTEMVISVFLLDICVFYYNAMVNPLKIFTLFLAASLIVKTLLEPLKFQIFDEKTIIYKNLFTKKSINISDLSSVTYNKYTWFKTIKGYINNKLVFRIDEKLLSSDDLSKPLKEILMKNNVKWVEK